MPAGSVERKRLFPHHKQRNRRNVSNLFSHKSEASFRRNLIIRRELYGSSSEQNNREHIPPGQITLWGIKELDSLK